MEQCRCGKRMVPTFEAKSGTTNIVAKCPEYGTDEVMWGPAHPGHQWIKTGRTMPSGHHAGPSVRVLEGGAP